MSQISINPKVHRVCALCGPALVVIFFVGLMPIAQFFPPPRPTESAQQITRLYLGNTFGIRFGVLLMQISMVMLVPWSLSMTVWVRRGEGTLPLLTYIQIAGIAMEAFTGVMFCIIWGVAAFRPGEVPPEVTRMMNDFGWFWFLFSWPCTAVFMLALGVGILTDKTGESIYPRWSAWFAIWTTVTFVSSGIIIFFKKGPFDFAGLMALYVPFFIFFIWLLTMTFFTLRGIKRYEEVQKAGEVVTAAPGGLSTPVAAV